MSKQLVICNTCSKEFSKPLCQVKEKNYCINECRYKSKIKYPDPVLINCFLCNKEKLILGRIYYSKLNSGDRGENFYCSKECGWKAQRTGVATKPTGRPTTNPVKRFFSFINKTENCWLWIGSKNESGYGMFRLNRKNWASHRYSYVIHNDNRPIPEGLFVCHKCDNPSCVNPEHLFLGTAKDNTQDMIRKGRFKNGGKGDDSSNKKLSWNKAQCIRGLYATNHYTYKQLGRIFGVCNQTICNIIKNKIWKTKN